MAFAEAIKEDAFLFFGIANQNACVGLGLPVLIFLLMEGCCWRHRVGNRVLAMRCEPLHSGKPEKNSTLLTPQLHKPVNFSSSSSSFFFPFLFVLKLVGVQLLGLETQSSY